ncbi:MAG: PQQ-dependent sugar dehydrogenase [Rhodoferax sp.]|nr:PQQ-dependent sugar dehydrogenase [Rhodoferax sp.]
MVLALCAAATVVSAQTVRPVTVASGLQHPWAVAFLPDGKFLVTERAGRLRVVSADGVISAPLRGMPDVDAKGQGGLLDLVLDSDFARNRTAYFCYAEPGKGGNGTALARAELSPDLTELQNLKVLFSQKPKVSSSLHFGCRIVERKVNGKPDGTLFLTLGDRYSRRDDAQTLDNHHGKVIRIRKDGSVPSDNPLVGQSGALPEIWSWGHRNPQGAALSPSGQLWLHEHGPQGGDEINLPNSGQNYGWPLISYGVEYSGAKIGDGLTAREGLQQPLHYWTPSIAPSGMAFVTTERYGKAWVGSLLVGSLKFAYLARLELSEPFSGKVLRETRLVPEIGERVRDVREAPDGFIYLLTDHPQGRLVRLQPG